MRIVLKKALVLSLILLFTTKGFAQGNSNFEFVQADKLYKHNQNDNQIIYSAKGNVEFIKGEIYLYCDSIFIVENKLECFGDVKLIKANHFTFTGDLLEIDQRKEKAIMMGRVFLRTPKKEIYRKRYKLKLK